MGAHLPPADGRRYKLQGETEPIRLSPWRIESQPIEAGNTPIVVGWADEARDRSRAPCLVFPTAGGGTRLLPVYEANLTGDEILLKPNPAYLVAHWAACRR